MGLPEKKGQAHSYKGLNLLEIAEVELGKFHVVKSLGSQ